MPEPLDGETAAFLSLDELLTLKDQGAHIAIPKLVALLPRYTWQARAVAQHGSRIVKMLDIIEEIGPDGITRWPVLAFAIDRPAAQGQPGKSGKAGLWLDRRGKWRAAW